TTFDETSRRRLRLGRRGAPGSRAVRRLPDRYHDEPGAVQVRAAEADDRVDGIHCGDSRPELGGVQRTGRPDHLRKRVRDFDNKRGLLTHCRALLPESGKMVMVAVTADRPMFRVVSKDAILAEARSAGFTVEVSESLSAHYIRTLEHFMTNL